MSNIQILALAFGVVCWNLGSLWVYVGRMERRVQEVEIELKKKGIHQWND